MSLEGDLEGDSAERSVQGNNSSSNNGAQRNRSRVACQSCNHRKVRCDVTKTGIPCSNCQDHASICEVLPRKKHRARSETQNSHVRSTHINTELEHAQVPSKQSHYNLTPNPRPLPVLEAILSPNANRPQSQPQLPLPASEQTPASIATSADSHITRHRRPSPDTDGVLPDDSSISYLGDRRGPRFSVYELCHPAPAQEAVPYLPSPASKSSWKASELECLREAGAFASLPRDVSDKLVRSYFQHVHSFLPVVDAASFLNEYVKTGTQNINPLLFWSMALAATNFVGAEVLAKAGYTSRKAMKVAFYARAKRLYDFDRGTEKLTLIQSVLLMGFWYSDAQDHTGAWYWIGIAISLCQSLGLHRHSQALRSGQRQPEELRRRLWWTCVIRDRWVSLAKGRPMRIHQEDCDVPLPAAEDITKELNTISLQARDKYMPPDAEILARMWTRFVNISAVLGSILRIHYRVQGHKPDVDEMNVYAQALDGCADTENLSNHFNHNTRLHAYQLELFYQAAIAILYRPYLLGELPAMSRAEQASWQKTAMEKARSAASSTNRCLEKIIELNAVHLLKPMIITSLIPAMQIHLFDLKSANPLVRGLASTRLRLCMLVLLELRDTYWSAGVMYRLFERAQQILETSSAVVTDGAEKPSRQSTSSESLLPDHTQESPEMRRQTFPQQNVPLANMVESTMPMANNFAPNARWAGQAMFSGIDQLLSPGFTVSEDAFENLFMGFDDGIGFYDPGGAMLNSGSIDLMYNG
ncbi:hypothetical protein LTS07_002364 [Exophiala sideris]|nr:hypothetical protein LTS07_002364 [Exophiala sideris]KAK5185079.1 hypothetical protein LTR44_002925 [Eurotiomycetes sp. CCFEE 6388]